MVFSWIKPAASTSLENALGDLGLLGSASASEVVKADVKPRINVPVDGEEAVAELLGAHAFLQGLGFRGGAVLISPADVEGLITGQSAVTGKDVGGKHLNEVPQVRDVVHVRKGRSH
jgi:hypothetical protein